MNIYKGETIFNNKKDMLLYKYTDISAYKTWLRTTFCCRILWIGVNK